MKHEQNLPLETKHLSTAQANLSTVDKITDAMINTLCVNLVREKNVEQQQNTLRFSEVKTEDEWLKVISLRLKVYGEKNQYMLNELTSGTDEHESRSSVYAAWLNDIPIATIRLTPYPFETMKYMEENKLVQFLGNDYRDNYLEWSRLLVDPDIKIIRIMPALVVYAGIKAITNSPYKKYFGFTKPIVRKLMRKFCIASDTLEFSIPARDNNKYLLLKGDFSHDFWRLVEKGFSFAA